MDGFVTALKAEFYVSLHSLGSKLVILVPAILVFAQFLLLRVNTAGQVARDSLLGGGSEFEAIAANNAYGFFVDGMSTGLTLLSLVLVAFSAYSFAYDRDTGALRHLLIRRVSRRALILAKLVHLHLLALLAIIILWFVTAATSAWFWQFGPVVEDGFELISEAEILREIALGLALALTPLPAAIAFGVLVSVCTVSATQAVTSALGITLALDIFKSVLGDVAYYLYATFQPSLLDQSYLQDVSRLVRGYSDVLINERILQLNLWVPWPQLIVFVVLALIVVQRRKL